MFETQIDSYITRIPAGDSYRVLGYRDEDTLFRDIDEACVDRLIITLPREVDYFPVWERARARCGHVYIIHERSDIRDKEADPIEILEWDGSAFDVELSVILPVYNVEQYLPQCIESLTAWKAPYVEYLFVNDGTKDDSAKVIEQYARRDSRIKLLEKENGGCASARNFGLDHAKGRYVGFVDPDDYVDTTMFKKLLSKALMGNYDLSYCGYREYYEDTGASEPVLNDTLAEPYVSGTYRVDKVQRMVINTRVAIWRCIYKRSMMESHHLRFHEDLKRFDDLPFKVECMFSALSAVCVPEYLYYYRLGRKGQDVSCRDERLGVHFEIFKYLDAFVEPMKDRRLLDYLQIIKLNTHGFAIERIEPRYKRAYIKKAAKQLDRHAGTLRTVCLTFVYGGKSNLGWYLRRHCL